MTKLEAKAYLNKPHPIFCYGTKKYDPTKCDLIILYNYIVNHESYNFSGDNKDIIREYKLIFNSRLTLGEGIKPFDVK